MNDQPVVSSARAKSHRSPRPLLGRRRLLRLAAASGLGAATIGPAYLAARSIGVEKEPAGLPSPSLAPSPSQPTSRWPGHEPGRIYLGWSDGGDFGGTLALTGQVALRRSYFKWTNAHAEEERIREDHQALRLPWVSFKPPDEPGSWAAVASGEHDADIRVRARRYAAVAAPVQRGVRVNGFFAPAKDHGVPAFHAQTGGVHRHVRPRFVDEEHHADRHTNL